MMDKVTVSASELHQLLTAFKGSIHEVTELWALQKSNIDNPVSILIREFNEEIDRHNEIQEFNKKMDGKKS